MWWYWIASHTLKRIPREDLSCPENVDKCAKNSIRRFRFLIIFFYQYLYNSRSTWLFCFDFELLTAQSYWFALYRRRTTTTKKLTHDVMYTSATLPGLVHDVTDKDCWTQSGSAHGPCFHDFMAVFSYFHGRVFMTSLPCFRDFIAVFSWLHCRVFITSWPCFLNFMALFSWLHGRVFVTSWPYFHDFIAVFLWLRDFQKKKTFFFFFFNKADHESTEKRMWVYFLFQFYR